MKGSIIQYYDFKLFGFLACKFIKKYLEHLCIAQRQLKQEGITIDR